jgi:hypothetical protein
MTFSESIKVMFSALRLLLRGRRTIAILLVVYAGLLASVYLFVSIREATILQLVWTLILGLLAPAFFFLLQAVSVNYASAPTAGSLLRRSLSDSWKLLAVTVPLLVLTLAVVYGLGRIQTAATAITTISYLLAGVILPLFAIQLWVATNTRGLRPLWRSFKEISLKALAPQSVFVYACGFLFFAVAPYYLLTEVISSERAWLEFSLLVLRLSVSALLILLGWVTTVGALSLLGRSSYAPATKE